MKLKMEDVANLAGVKAQETNKVVLTFEKDDVEIILTSLEVWNGDRFEAGLDDDPKIDALINRLKLAQTKWVF